MAEVKFGCVRFDDPHQHEAGWAALAGQKPFRVRGTEDLASDTAWITNLDFDLMFDSGLSGHARFRRQDYLGEPFYYMSEPDKLPKYDLVKSVGIAEEHSPVQVAFGAAIFARVMRMAERFLGMNEVPQQDLCGGLRNLLDYDPVLPERLVMAMSEADIPNVFCESHRSHDGRILVFLLPRVAHARMLLNHPLPDPSAEWKQVAKTSLPTPEKAGEWAARCNLPGLMRVTVHQTERSMNPLINYGSGGKAKRFWVTTHELISLAKTSEVTVHEAFLCQNILPPSRFAAVINNFKDTHELSLSAGLFAQALWVALAKQRKPPSWIAKGQPSANPGAPFLRAADRHMCLVKAMELQMHGFEIVGYGRGKVRVFTMADDNQIADIARKLDLIPPALKASATAVNPTDALAVLREAYLTGATETIMKLDEAFSR